MVAIVHKFQRTRRGTKQLSFEKPTKVSFSAVSTVFFNLRTFFEQLNWACCNDARPQVPLSSDDSGSSYFVNCFHPHCVHHSPYFEIFWTLMRYSLIACLIKPLQLPASEG